MSQQQPYHEKTRWVIVCSSILHEPFASLYPLLPFILLNLGASAFQIVLLTMLKPVASIVSFYWSERLSQRRHSLRLNFLGAALLARLPFLGVLFCQDIWFLIACSTLYMIFTRASIPAWMEILKLNLPNKLRERQFALGSALGYAEGVLIAIGIGSLLDKSVDTWQIFYAVAIGIGIIGACVQAALPIYTPLTAESAQPKKEIAEQPSMSWKESLLRPWQDCLHLMQERSDFRRFQWAFMVGGLGLMVIQPVIPLFFKETLHLSYRDLMIAYSVCKGLGFVLSSQLWSYAMNRISVSYFTSLVLLGFALFPLCIILALQGQWWIYIAYIIYGVAQAGSHLIWHLSGPLFADQESSSRYSGVNIVMVGVRGLIGPPLGGLLAALFGPLAVLLLSIFFCISGTGSLLFRAPPRLTKLNRP